ncbi:hypothetical protein FWD20_01055 [Candidatus Saccharibacteria bacterium]|nr:hypothetical protein [Candidatus Saccharibacteria bacterium]
MQTVRSALLEYCHSIFRVDHIYDLRGFVEDAITRNPDWDQDSCRILRLLTQLSSELPPQSDSFYLRIPPPPDDGEWTDNDRFWEDRAQQRKIGVDAYKIKMFCLNRRKLGADDTGSIICRSGRSASSKAELFGNFAEKEDITAAMEKVALAEQRPLAELALNAAAGTPETP